MLLYLYRRCLVDDYLLGQFWRSSKIVCWARSCFEDSSLGREQLLQKNRTRQHNLSYIEKHSLSNAHSKYIFFSNTMSNSSSENDRENAIFGIVDHSTLELTVLPKTKNETDSNKIVFEISSRALGGTRLFQGDPIRWNEKDFHSSTIRWEKNFFMVVQCHSIGSITFTVCLFFY